VLFFDGVGGLFVLALWIFCFIDVLMTPEAGCRSLPKLAWVFIVLLVPFLGSIGWLVAGRPWDRSAQQYVSARSSARVAASRQPAARPMSPDDDEEFLAGLRKRAEEQRRRAREQQEHDQPDDGGA
jgi:hypothetical protein